MSIIRIKRTTGSTTPTGLTFGEPAYVQGLKSLYIGQTGGDPAIRIGAEVSTDSAFASASDNKIPSQLAVKTYIDNNVAAGAVSTLNGLTGAVFIDVGTALSIASAGKGITLTNTGVQSLTGTTNQITVSGATGAVTLSLPSTVTVPGALNVTTNLTVTGNLTVNGTTTTVNSDVMTVDDPLIIIGTSGGVPIAASDGGKDRGIAFNYFDTAGRTGFFGYDASASEFIFTRSATVNNDVVTGISFANLRIGTDLLLQTSGGFSDIIRGGGANNTHTLSLNYGGEIVSSGTYPTATGYILKSNEALGSPAQPTWINPNAAGFTAFTSTNVLTASDTTDTSTFIAFVPLASATNQGIKYNSGLTYNAVTNSISATTFVGAFSGNATTATTLQTARNIGITGDINGTATSFNGSADINISAQIAAGSIIDADINASAAIVDTKLSTISTANKVSLSALDIDGGTETTTIVGSDLLIVDDGANGTNRKVTVDNLFGANSTATVDGGSY